MNKITNLDKLELIPVSDLNIEFDPTERVGYDFFVEDYKTFSTHDGVFLEDCMAIYIPVTDISIKDVKENITIENNLISPTDISIVPRPNQDIILGIYTATKNLNDELIEYKGQKLTIGRYLFNKCLPENYPVVDKEISKKELMVIINDIALKYSQSVTMETLDNIKELGFKLSTVEGYTLGIDDVYREELVKLRNEKLTGNMIRDLKFMNRDEELKSLLESLTVCDYVESGARGSWDQVKQAVFTRGYVADANNQIRPNLIKNSLVSGLNPKEFFDSCWGARKGLLDTALSTGDSGYLTRQLIYSTVDMVLDESNEDCGTKDYLEFDVFVTDEKTGQIDQTKSNKLSKTLLWRYFINDDGETELITLKNRKDIIGKRIKLRSPIYCKSKKICKKCYGSLYKHLHSDQIGIIAVQAIGEISVQLVLRSFHTSGVAQGSGEGGKNDDIISGMEIVNKIFHRPADLEIKSAESMVRLLHNVFSQYGSLQLCHYETIVASMMWYDNEYWRLVKYRNKRKWEFVSILQIPSKSSWLLGCAFANVKQKLLDGLLEERIDNTSSLTSLFKL